MTARRDKFSRLATAVALTAGLVAPVGAADPGPDPDGSWVHEVPQADGPRPLARRQAVMAEDATGQVVMFGWPSFESRAATHGDGMAASGKK